MDIFADLEAEDDRFEAILEGLDEEGWRSPSSAPGWSVADVVLHLAQTDEGVVASAADPTDDDTWRDAELSTDELMARQVRSERLPPDEVFKRWQTARRAAVDAMRNADPRRKLRWAAAPLKPATLATTRLAEHWAHALDVADPLGLDYPDTDRLRHIAWLGHTTLPYAFTLAGQEPQPVRCELGAPSGDVWHFGPNDAPSSIVGPAGAFCRVGAERLTPERSGLVTTGPHAATALRILRNYAA